MKSQSLIGLGAAVVALGIGIYAFGARSEDTAGFGPHFMQHGPEGMMGRGMGADAGMMGAIHDSATMEQLQVIHLLFTNHDRIKRTVTNLPDGIRTVTESDDPAIVKLLTTHVVAMMKRIDAGDDPGLPIESPALHAIFRDKEKVRTTTEPTASGVVVVQTSDDPQTVTALQEHAAQVSDFVAEGMAALHTTMMRRFGGSMQRGMMAPGMRRGPN
jgi:hypothetical protein